MFHLSNLIGKCIQQYIYIYKLQIYLYIYITGENILKEKMNKYKCDQKIYNFLFFELSEKFAEKRKYENFFLLIKLMLSRE